MELKEQTKNKSTSKKEEKEKEEEERRSYKMTRIPAIKRYSFSIFVFS